MLTEQDMKHWVPIPAITDWLAQQIPEGAKVLEIGPGYVPFPEATHFIDRPFDVNNTRLPFEDKTFDFVYCLHVLEDLYNPFFLCQEMSRIGKAGYIETPSPLAEVTRGVDGTSPPWRGYHHHRFIVWKQNSELMFMTKFPFIETQILHVDDSMGLEEILKEDSFTWNTYFLWKDEIKFRHLQHEIDLMLSRHYAAFIEDGVRFGLTNSRRFKQVVGAL